MSDSESLYDSMDNSEELDSDWEPEDSNEEDPDYVPESSNFLKKSVLMNLIPWMNNLLKGCIYFLFFRIKFRINLWKFTCICFHDTKIFNV